eukprot:g2444.t1
MGKSGAAWRKAKVTMGAVQAFQKFGRAYKLEGNPEYDTSAMRFKRQRLEAHPEIERRFNRFWGILDMVKDHNGGLKKESYVKLNYKIQLAMVSDFDPEEALADSERDWEHDCQRSLRRGSDQHAPPSMSYNGFCRSMFELADLWTDGVELSAYAQYLDMVLAAVVQDMAAEVLRFKPDADIGFVGALGGGGGTAGDAGAALAGAGSSGVGAGVGGAGAGAGARVAGAAAAGGLGRAAATVRRLSVERGRRGSTTFGTPKEGGAPRAVGAGAGGGPALPGGAGAGGGDGSSAGAAGGGCVGDCAGDEDDALALLRTAIRGGSAGGSDSDTAVSGDAGGIAAAAPAPAQAPAAAALLRVPSPPPPATRTAARDEAEAGAQGKGVSRGSGSGDVATPRASQQKLRGDGAGAGRRRRRKHADMLPRESRGMKEFGLVGGAGDGDWPLESRWGVWAGTASPRVLPGEGHRALHTPAPGPLASARSWSRPPSPSSLPAAPRQPAATGRPTTPAMVRLMRRAGAAATGVAAAVAIDAADAAARAANVAAAAAALAMQHFATPLPAHCEHTSAQRTPTDANDLRLTWWTQFGDARSRPATRAAGGGGSGSGPSRSLQRARSYQDMHR